MRRGPSRGVVFENQNEILIEKSDEALKKIHSHHLRVEVLLIVDVDIFRYKAIIFQNNI